MAKILIADSSALSRVLLTQFLERDGHEVRFLEDVDAFDKMINEHKFDLAVFDAFFKGGSCEDLVKKFSGSLTNADTQIVVSTPRPEKNFLAKMTSLGVSSLFAKPYSYGLLSEKIKSMTRTTDNMQGAFDTLVVKIFLESVLHVFLSNIQLMITAGKPFLKQDNKRLSEITAMMKMSSSQVRGSMSVSLSREILSLFVVKMLGNTVAPDEAAMADICGEICNQILGNAKQRFLKRKNMSFDISLPKVFTSDDYILDHNMSFPVLVIPFLYEKKQSLFLEFCLQFQQGEEPSPSDKLVVAVEEGSFIQF